jgi:hypothetical protein
LCVRLSTLLGQDQYRAELAGWGSVHAELARDLITTLGGARWRFAITDEQGQLSHCGITQSRTTGISTRMAGWPAIVKLAVTAATLRALRENLTGWVFRPRWWPTCSVSWNGAPSTHPP